MNCITVFVVNQESQLKNLLQDTNSLLSHRMFILNGFDVDKRKLSYVLQSDIFLSYNTDIDLEIKIVQRIALLYSDPIYEKIIIPQNEFELSDIEEIVNKDYEESIQNNKFIILSRQDVMLNGIKFNKVNIVNENLLEESDNMIRAMSGEPVEEKYFLKALEELVPVGKFDYSHAKDLISLNYLQYYNNPNAKNSVYIYYNPSNLNFQRPSIVLVDNGSELENYSFLIQRLDGLKLYIY